MKRIRALRIGQVVGISFGLILVLALITGILGRVAYEVSQWQRETIQTRGSVNRLTLELEIISIRRTAALRRFLSSADPSFLEAHSNFQTVYAETLANLANLISTPEEIQALDAVKAAEAAFSRKEEEILQLYEDGFDASARFLWDTEGADVQELLLDAIERLRFTQGNTSELLVSRANRTEAITITAISIVVPMMLVGGVVMGLYITHKISSPISNLVKTVRTLGFDLSARVDPSGPQEIAFLGETINQMAGNLHESQRSLQAYRNRLEQELTLASQIQASFLPNSLPQTPNLELAVYWKSAREVAGDFYASIELGDGRRGIAVGDVTGKGTPAAMTGTLAEGLLEVYAPFHLKPETLLATLNRDLAARLAPNHMNVACCYAIFDDASQTLTVANAGCICPYLRRGYRIEEIDIGGLPLGSTVEVEYTSVTMRLEPDDLIIFSSDGLVEAMNEQNEMFGFDRFQAELSKLPFGANAQEAIDHLVSVVMNFTDHDDLHDDLTILAARVIGAGCSTTGQTERTWGKTRAS